MERAKLKEIASLAKSTRALVPTTNNPTPEETKALFTKLRAVAGVCMNGADLREALKESIAAERQGELYDAARIIQRMSNTFSGDDGPAIRDNLALIAEILDEAAGPDPSTPLDLRREILEELYELNTRSPQASGTWSAQSGDPVSAARAREAEYLKERGLVSGTIGGHGDLALRLTADGRDFVEVGGFWSKATSGGTSTPPATENPAENKLPRMDVSYGPKLGSGAFGTVWRATDDLLARDIAVKFLTSTDEAMDEDALIREARSLARLAHPNLVTVYAAAWLRHPETRFVAPAITMELLHGETLEKWWSHAHARDEVLRVAAGLIAGILAMHQAGLVHGDLHEGNVMILADATAKLIDWRYHDTFLQRSSSHRRNEIAAEQRRALDRVDTLFEKQGLYSERSTIRGKDLSAVGNIINDLLFSQHVPAPLAPTPGMKEAQRKLETAVQLARSTTVILVGGVTELAGNIRRDAVNGEIQLGARNALSFELRIPCGKGGIPILTVPYELLHSAWVDAAGRLNVMLELPVVWNGREFSFERR